MKLSFVPLSKLHFPLLLTWLETPHVKAWWDQDVHWTSELIHGRHGQYMKGYKRLQLGDQVIEKPMHAYIIMCDGDPIGYIQLYNAHDFPRENADKMGDLPTNCAAIDWYIGEPAYIGKGIGPKALDLFLKEHVFPHFDMVFVDPDTANARAIRAYAKTGFTVMKTMGEVTWMTKVQI